MALATTFSSRKISTHYLIWSYLVISLETEIGEQPTTCFPPIVGRNADQFIGGINSTRSSEKRDGLGSH